MVGGALLWYNKIPYLPGGWPTNWKIIMSQRFSHRIELSPMSGSPAWGSGIGKRSPQSIWHWRSVGLECRSCTGLMETETPLLEGSHKVSHALGPRPRAKQWLHRSPGQTYLWISESLEEAEVGCGSMWGQGPGGGSLRVIFVSVTSPEGCRFGTKTWPHPTGSRLQCWVASSQTTNRVGTQPDPLADRLPEFVLSAQPQLNTLLDMALPTRGTRPSSTPVGRQQFLPPGRLNKSLDQPHPPGVRYQKQEELQTCSLRNRNHKQTQS